MMPLMGGNPYFINPAQAFMGNPYQMMIPNSVPIGGV